MEKKRGKGSCRRYSNKRTDTDARLTTAEQQWHFALVKAFSISSYLHTFVTSRARYQARRISGVIYKSQATLTFFKVANPAEAKAFSPPGSPARTAPATDSLLPSTRSSLHVTPLSVLRAEKEALVESEQTFDDQWPYTLRGVQVRDAGLFTQMISQDNAQELKVERVSLDMVFATKPDQAFELLLEEYVRLAERYNTLTNHIFLLHDSTVKFEAPCLSSN